MAEVCVFLLEALVGVVLDRVFNQYDTTALIDEVEKLQSTVVDLQHQVLALEKVITQFTDKVPDEVVRFRRVREKTHFHLRDFDPTLIDFATELVASLLNGLALGFQLKVHATKKALNRGRAFEARDFEVVLGASKTVLDNVLVLKRLFNAITEYVDFQAVSRLEKPTITLNMVCGSTIEFKALELMRYRISLRLHRISTMALNWSTSCLGTLELNDVLFGKHDEYLSKFVNNTQMDSNVQVECFPRVFWSNEYKQLTDVLRSTVKDSVSCFRVLILSFDNWITSDAAEYHGFSSKIRTFVSGRATRCVEVKLKDYSHWDHINLEQILFWGLSMSVVVFRFCTPEHLALMLEASTQITLKYPGLIEDVQRVLYVETSSTDNVGDVRQNIKDVAVRKRMLEPRDEEDILFEESYGSVEEMMEYIRGRGKGIRSIINNDVKGESRDLMISIARILNHELTEDEAMDDTQAVVKFASKIRENAMSSKIDLYRDKKEMVLSNGDYNTGFLPHIAHHVRDSEYEDFRSVPKHSTMHLRLTIRMYGVDRVWQHCWCRKWKAFKDALELVQAEQLFLTTVFEEKNTMRKCNVGSAGPIVSRVSVFAMGGGDRDDYLHARLQQCVMRLSELERKEAGWAALRVLLKLIPELVEFCRKPKDT